MSHCLESVFSHDALFKRTQVIRDHYTCKMITKTYWPKVKLAVFNNWINIIAIITDWATVMRVYLVTHNSNYCNAREWFTMQMCELVFLQYLQVYFSLVLNLVDTGNINPLTWTISLLYLQLQCTVCYNSFQVISQMKLIYIRSTKVPWFSSTVWHLFSMYMYLLTYLLCNPQMLFSPIVISHRSDLLSWATWVVHH